MSHITFVSIIVVRVTLTRVLDFPGVPIDISLGRCIRVTGLCDAPGDNNFVGNALSKVIGSLGGRGGLAGGWCLYLLLGGGNVVGWGA